MRASTRQKQRRAERREQIRQARELWRDEQFGMRLEQRKGGTRVIWDVDGRDPMVALLALERLRAVVLAGIEVELVAQLRLDGLSWEDIGWGVGITGEAARKRYTAAEVLAQEVAAGA